jgi:hypothetical protein
MLSISVAVQKGEERRGKRGEEQAECIDTHGRETLFQGIRGDMPHDLESGKFDVEEGKFRDTKHGDLNLHGNA